jgi:hypothetical protein
MIRHTRRLRKSGSLIDEAEGEEEEEVAVEAAAAK